MRRKAIDGAVTTLATVTVANGYEYDLSASGQVSKRIETIEGRRSDPRRATIRVSDGPETFIRRTLGVQHLVEARLTILLDVLLADVTGEDMVDQLNDLIRDVHQCIEANRDLGTSGAISSAYVTQIAEPEYDLSDAYARVGIVVEVVYDYQSGTGL